MSLSDLGGGGGGGGFIGAISRLPGDFFRGAKQAAIASVPGLYHMGKSVYEDIADRGFYGGDPEKSAFRTVIIPLAKGLQETAEHPLRNPFNTLTLVLPVANVTAGTALRLGAAGRLAAAGKTGSAAKALVSKPPYKPRIIGYTTKGGKRREVEVNAFRTPVSRGAQRLMDKARERFPEGPMGRVFSPFHGSLKQKVVAEMQINERLLLAAEEGGAAELAAIGKRLNRPQQVAIYVQQVGRKNRSGDRQISVDDHIAAHQRWIDEGVGSKRGHEKWIKWLEESRQYLNPTSAGPRIKKEYTDVRKAADLMEEAAQKREQIFIDLGVLDPEAAAARRAADANMILYGRTAPSTPEELQGVLGKDFPEGPILSEQQAFTGGQRVPSYETRPLRRKKERIESFKPAPSHKQPVPRSLTHDYDAQLLQSGKMRPLFTQFMAESVTEAERFAALLRGRREIATLVHESQTSKFDVPVDLTALQELPAQYAQILTKVNEGKRLTAEETQMLGMAFEGVRQKMFPEKYSTEAAGANIKWIDQRELGDLHKPTPFTKTAAGRGTGKVLDAINDASRLAFIYLKFGYIPANMLGNVAMNIIHQGFAAPWNLARASALNWKMSPATRAKMDRLMGLGITSLASGETTALHRVSTAYAEQASKLIDRVPRRAAFIAEARKAGFSTVDDLERLMSKTKHRDQLVQVLRQSREAIGDYERLSRVEKHLIRRIIFFYPWLKVSTRMTGRTLAEHPFKSAAISQIGELGAEYQREMFGLPKMPAGFEGLIPLGGGKVFDPRAISIWATPAELGETAYGLTQGNYPNPYDISQLGVPWIGSALTMVTGNDPYTGYPVDKDLWGGPLRAGVYEGFVKGIPIWSLARKHWEDQTSRLYPQSPSDAWLQFGTSGYRGRYNPSILADILERQEQ